jgi:hypothetical protein
LLNPKFVIFVGSSVPTLWSDIQPVQISGKMPNAAKSRKNGEMKMYGDSLMSRR